MLVKSLFLSVTVPGRASSLGPFSCEIEHFLNPRIYLGFEAETLLADMALSREEQDLIRKRCLEFTVGLFKQVRQRVPDCYDVLRQTSVLSVRNALKVDRQPLTELLRLFNTHPEMIGKVERQWQQLSLVDWRNVTDTVKFWAEVSNHRDAIGVNPYMELCDFATSVVRSTF